jgi:hypothetical protein
MVQMGGTEDGLLAWLALNSGRRVATSFEFGGIDSDDSYPSSHDHRDEAFHVAGLALEGLFECNI